MRIAILTTVFPPLDGRIFYKQAVSFAEAGNQVTLFAPRQPGVKEIAHRHGITYIPLRPIGKRHERPLQWLYLVRLLRRQPFEVWHFHDPELLPLVLLWKHLFARQVRLVYDVHEDFPQDILHKAWIPKWLRRPVSYSFAQVERLCVRHCQLVLTPTDAITQRMSCLTTHTVLVRNYPIIPAEAGAFSARLPAQDKPVRVIYCGNMTEPRGIREIVQAMDRLRDCNIKLTLLGLLYPEQFEQEIRQCAGPNVEIISKVPFDQVPAYLQASDIGIVCLRPIKSFVESLPVKLFEYMQAGLPVIASDFPLWRTIIEDAGCGILVDPCDPKKIAEAMRVLAFDSDLRRRMGEAGAQAVVEKYSWQREANTMFKAFEQLA
jgi:glycosyltransferase involved in cell wall biosynthesis